MHEGLEPTGFYNTDDVPLYRLKPGWKLQGLTFEAKGFISSPSESEVLILPVQCAVVKDEPCPDRIVEDGFGGAWAKCDRPDCDLYVVRPGKVQCSCESPNTPEEDN